LEIRYANGSSNARPLELKVDGTVAVSRVAFPSTGGWPAWKTASEQVTLPAGTHKVRLTAVGQSGPNVDSLTVRSDDDLPPPPPPPPGPGNVLQAESAKFSGAQISKAHAGYTGSGYLDFTNASNDFIEWNVNAAKAETYDVTFRYANGKGSSRPLELRVNGQVVQASMAFASTGSWSTWRTVTARVPLAAGANRVRLTAIGSGGPNVDSMTAPVTQVVSDRTLRVYHIGNSVTNTIGYGSLDKLADSDGRDYEYGRHMISGAPMEFIWSHTSTGFKRNPYGYYPQALTQYEWDAITLQPFDRQLYQDGGIGDVQTAQKFIDLTLPKSPNVQFYIFQRWPKRTPDGSGGYTYDYENLWQRPYTGKWDRSYETRDYFNQVVSEIRKNNPDMNKPVLMIPVGEVMFELNRRVEAGQVPGLNSMEDLFFDGIHLNNWGAMIVGMTVYSTMYSRDPRGLDFSPWDVVDDSWDRNITADYARAVQEAVWSVVSTHPLSGVTADSGD
jgi:hypothetical protein